MEAESQGAPAAPQSSTDAKPIELDRRDRVALLFRKATEMKVGTLILMEGVDLPSIKRLGKLFAKIPDPRHYHAVRPRGFEKNRPLLYEYWAELPRHGDLALYEHSYYYALARRIRGGKFKGRALKRALSEFQSFETTLENNGYLVIKLNLERGRKALRKDFEKKYDKKPEGKIVRKRFRRFLDGYKKYTEIYADLRERSESTGTPWFSPKTGDKRELEASVLDFLIEYLEQKLGCDSLAEVREFDEAMRKVREMAKGNKDVTAG